jgi:predicted DsbA family dithiol-disulfide isomerase
MDIKALGYLGFESPEATAWSEFGPEIFGLGLSEGRDIGDPTVLADIGASAGLDRTRILAMLASDEGQAEVRSELQRAVNLRVSGVPTVLVDGVPLFFGAIRAELMEAALRNAAGHVRR